MRLCAARSRWPSSSSSTPRTSTWPSSMQTTCSTSLEVYLQCSWELLALPALLPITRLVVLPGTSTPTTCVLQDVFSWDSHSVLAWATNFSVTARDFTTRTWLSVSDADTLTLSHSTRLTSGNSRASWPLTSSTNGSDPITTHTLSIKRLGALVFRQAIQTQKHPYLISLIFLDIFIYQ